MENNWLAQRAVKYGEPLFDPILDLRSAEFWLVIGAKLSAICRRCSIVWHHRTVKIRMTRLAAKQGGQVFDRIRQKYYLTSMISVNIDHQSSSHLFILLHFFYEAKVFIIDTNAKTAFVLNAVTRSFLSVVGAVYKWVRRDYKKRQFRPGRLLVAGLDNTIFVASVRDIRPTKPILILLSTLVFSLASCSSPKPRENNNVPPSNNVMTPAKPISVLQASTKTNLKPLEPYIENGTGTFVSRTKPNNANTAIIDSDKNLTLNMVDVELGEVVSKVLGDQLNLDYVIDPRIEGRVNVRTSRELPAEDILSILDSVLNLNGAALVEDDGLYKVLPINQITSSGIRPEVHQVDNVSRNGFGIEIVPIRFIDADNLVEILKPILSADSTVQINSQRNTVLLVGPREELQTLIDTIQIFDVDWMKGMSFGLFDLEFANAKDLIRELTQLFAGFGESVATNTLRFVPIERLNAIIVVAAQPTYLEKARAWIERLDTAADGSEEQIFFYSVQNGRAADLAHVLSSIFEIENTIVKNGAANRKGRSLAPGLNPIEFTTSPDGENSEFDEYASYFQDYESSSHGDWEYSPERNQKREARIVADEINNSLLIRTTVAGFKKIEAAIREIDVQPVQVLLEATIAEVTLKDELSYGIQWFFRFGSGNITLSELPNGSVNQVFPGFSGLFSNNDVRAVFDALDSVSDVRIISSPQLLVLDNQTAQLEVGDQVPIVTQQSQGNDGTGDRLVNTIEQRQTGVILNVTPRVNASGLVVLDIQQEVSDVVQTTTSGIDSPTISQRRIGTSIAVGNHQTVALGGLIRDRTAKSNLGIPLLSSIPIVGSLFGTTSDLTARTELLILITPNVIRDYREAEAVTEELRGRFRSLSPLEKKLNKRSRY